MRRLFAIVLALSACGPKPTPYAVPTLPGDGTANLTKPADPATPNAADPWAGRTDLIAPPPPAPPSAVELPAIEQYKLKNGLDVRVVKTDRMPTASLQIAIKAGRMHEPRARLGVSELAANMLVKGTQKKTAQQLAKAVDFVGGTIAADSTFEATLVSCSVLARNFDTCMTLVPEMIMAPAFPQAEIDPTREGLMAEVRNRVEDAGAMAAAHVQNLLWGPEHVRGWITNEQSIKSIKREDLVAWHKAWFTPKNAVLVVAGNVDPKKLKLDLERTFGAWKGGPVPPTPQYKEPGLSGSRIRLVDKPGQAQTHIRVAQFGIQHEDPRFFDTLVWNHALGGSATSRIVKAVRGDGSGKAFGASSSFDRNLDKGSFVVQAVAKGSEALATTKLLLEQVEKMAKEGPTQQEVAAAIASIGGGYGMRFQASSDIGGALVGAELHGFGREYLTNFPLAIGKVTAESAKRSAAEILDPKSYVVVMVGDAKDLEPQLKKAGWRYQKVSFAEPITPSLAEPEAPVDPKVAAAAKKLVDEAIAAKGGKAKLAALKGFKMIAEGETTINQRNVPVNIERVFLLPDKMRIDALLDGRVKVTVSVNGRVGWQLAPDQSGQQMQLSEISGAEISSIDFERWREPELILLRAADPKARIEVGPDETIDGKPHSILKVRSPFNNVDIVIAIDKTTKLIKRMSYSEGRISESDTFADYKDVNGLKIAHSRHSVGNMRQTKLTLKSVELDPKVDAKFFDKPAK